MSRKLTAAARKEQERLERKRKRNSEYQTSPEYKARRKARYAQDAEYRARCIAQATEFNEQKKAVDKAMYASAVRRQLNKRSSIGQHRRYRKPDSERFNSGLTFSIAETATLICRTPKSLRGWVNTYRFPAPPYIADNGLRVFSEPQAVRLADAAIAHLGTRTAHLTESRVSAIIALRKAAG